MKFIFIIIIKKIIVKYKIQPYDILNKFKNVLFALKHTLKFPLTGLLKPIFYKKNLSILYKLRLVDFSLINVQNKTNIAINKYSDLLLYKDRNAPIRKSEVLSKALSCFSSGELLYTNTKDGVLAHYGWIIKSSNVNKLPFNHENYEFSENSLIFHGFFTDLIYHEEEFFQDLLHDILIECILLKALAVYIFIDESNIQFIKAIEKAGFDNSFKFRK